MGGMPSMRVFLLPRNLGELWRLPRRSPNGQVNMRYPRPIPHFSSTSFDSRMYFRIRANALQLFFYAILCYLIILSSLSYLLQIMENQRVLKKNCGKFCYLKGNRDVQKSEQSTQNHRDDSLYFSCQESKQSHCDVVGRH